MLQYDPSLDMFPEQVDAERQLPQKSWTSDEEESVEIGQDM